jgi:hypothetical protein
LICNLIEPLSLVIGILLPRHLNTQASKKNL